MHNERFDVLILGAGLSGIGAACHLRRECPDKSFAILERRAAIGGTWDLFRYPGIRSDSDMLTLGYNFKPWKNPKAIADGPDIRTYIQEAAKEYDLAKHIRFQQRVKKVSWSTVDSLWRVEVEVTDPQSGQLSTVQVEASFIIGCTGYYNYDKGYEPEFAGRENFPGPVIHPQHWPENLDYQGKRIVIIGSGATAVTLIPSLAEKASQVTMLQRSPTYIMEVPNEDVVADFLRRYLPDHWVYRFARTRNILLSLLLYKFSRAFPAKMKRFLLSQVHKSLGDNYKEENFSPAYQPWDERLCVVPDGDLFAAIRSGKASVVTGQIERFTPQGVQLSNGELLAADIIVTATGLDVQALGGAEIELDGKLFNVSNRLCYKGLMFEDIPNFGMVFGYTNASWTLKSDLTLHYLCRLLRHMDKTGATVAVPRNKDASLERLPFMDMTSGYIQRASAILPRQGAKYPWRLYQNYLLDRAMLAHGRIDDGIVELRRGRPLQR